MNSSIRAYRKDIAGKRLRSFQVKVRESDLWVAVSGNAYHSALPAEVEAVLYRVRQCLEAYLREHPDFGLSLEPCFPQKNAPLIAQKMSYAAARAGVGPMAAVAGAVAEQVGLMLAGFSEEVIVENGGDIFIAVSEPLLVGVHAGCSALSGKLALLVDPDKTPLGVCTSSGTVGPSLSFGSADAAVVVSPSTALADAAATALCNRVSGPSDLECALRFASQIEGLSGALLIFGEKAAARGDIELREV